MGTPRQGFSEEAPSKKDLDLIQTFEADYNAVDQWLRSALHSDSRVPFTQIVREYSGKHAGWRDAEILKTIAEIRNTIVHSKTEPYRYVAIPTPFIVRQLKNCRERLLNPDDSAPKSAPAYSFSPNLGLEHWPYPTEFPELVRGSSKIDSRSSNIR